MFSFMGAKRRLITVLLVILVLLCSACGGGGADLGRGISSILTVGVDTGSNDGTTVDFNSDVQLDTCWITLVNGSTYQFDLNDAYSTSVHVSANPRLKYARVLAKNGGDYWYFDRSGTYMPLGTSDPKVAIPGDY